jgi:acyl-CoA reductase-like NAD-dependent aldehyde dehydrogenase
MDREIETINPATGEKVAKFKLDSLEDALRAARNARAAFDASWSVLSIAQRSEYMKRLASSLRSKKRHYAEIMTTEMGKPVSQAESEIEKCAWTAEVYAERGEKWLANEIAGTDAKLSYVTFQPLGAILSVMPWNFPFWQAFRFAIPALMAGNTSILRHSNVCPGSALAIEECFTNAEFPHGVFHTKITDHETVTKLIESEWISGVSLTGSVEAGMTIGEAAGRNLKKCVLELGGSDPFIVLEDADVRAAAEVGANARLLNSGQSCICAKRFIVAESIAREFTEGMVKEFEKKKVGDPMDPKTDVGPLSSAKQVETVESQVTDAKAKGARVEIGGRKVDGKGAFYEPTVLTKIKPEMKVMTEEIFGPVAPILPVANQNEAIRVANDSEFGLGASVWTTSPEKAADLAVKIQSGMIFINGLVKSDPRIPFGGIKKSGLGRELSHYGLREFVNVKTVSIYGIESAMPVSGGGLSE